MSERPDLTVLITSTELGAGKSTIAAVLANLLSNVGIETVIIREGEPHDPQYGAMYDRRMSELREHLRTHGYDEIENRKITIIERTVA